MKKVFDKIKYNFIGNAYFIRKQVLAAVFTAFIIGFAALNIINCGDVLGQNISKTYRYIVDNNVDIQEQLVRLDSKLQENIYLKMDYIEYFSYVQKLLDKKEVKNFAYIKDETGSIHYASFFREYDEQCFEYALRVKRLKDYVAQYGTDVLFVVAPSKYISNDGRMPMYMPVNDPQIIVEETLFYLNRLGVDTLDLNTRIPNNEVPYEQAFFKTDHHWTVPAAFCATRVLADTLNENYSYDLDVDTYLDKNNFRKEVYENAMLGSMGRATGANYSGMDDMVAFYPKYHLDIQRTCMEESGNYSNYEGDVLDTLIHQEALRNENIYSDAGYSMYLNGLRQYEHIVNRSNPDGKKIFMIRDSYFSPVITFLTPMVGEIDAIWSLETMDELDIEQYVRDNRFDCIIVEMYQYNIGDDAFQFFME